MANKMHRQRIVWPAMACRHGGGSALRCAGEQAIQLMSSNYGHLDRREGDRRSDNRGSDIPAREKADD
ncbi:MAG: hypothetical protein IRY87_08310 [Acetobacteraceae bacterium]|nr:hypothetical protein [Acetobacteraceae bacterium]